MRHLDDCEISARLNGLKPWRLPTHLRTSTLQTTTFSCDFLSVLLQVSRLVTEVDGHHYDKRHLAGDGVQDESDEEVDYHYHVEEHLAHEGARRVQVDAT